MPDQLQIDLRSAKVADVEVVVEGLADHSITWASVEIYYAVGDVLPEIKIRVPLRLDSTWSESRVQSEALRGARELMNHACKVPILALKQPEVDRNPAETILSTSSLAADNAPQ